MEEIKRCCFAGHSDVWENDLKDKIKAAAEDLIINHNVKDFWVGDYGAFDKACSSVIKELKQTHADITLELVIPYLTKSLNDHKELYCQKYDNILIADIPENTPKKFYITKANEYIVSHSQYLICFIQRGWGGAVTTYNYAKRKGLFILNIAETSNF